VSQFEMKICEKLDKLNERV